MSIEKLSNKLRTCELCEKDKIKTIYMVIECPGYPVGTVICKDCVKDMLKLFESPKRTIICREGKKHD